MRHASTTTLVSRILSCCLCTDDRYRRWWLQLIFLLLGIGVLIPWNAFISAKAYFESRLCVVKDASGEASSSKNVVSTFALVYNLSSVAMLTLMIALESLRDRWCNSHTDAARATTPPISFSDNPVATGSANALTVVEQDPLNRAGDVGLSEEGTIDTGGTATVDLALNSSKESNGNSFWLVTVPLSLYLLVFCNQAFMVLVPRMRLVWEWTILGLVICGMSTGIAGAGIVASAGLLEASVAMNPYLMGQSLGGVAVSVANFIAAMEEDPSDFAQFHCHQNPHTMQRLDVQAASNATTTNACIPYRKVDWSMFTYFACATLLIIACLMGFSCIDRVRDVPSHTDGDYESVVLAESSGMVEDEPREGSRSGLVVHPTPPPPLNDMLRMDDADDLGATIRSVPLHDPASAVPLDEPTTMESNSCTSATIDDASVWSKIRGPAICIFLTFFVTLALFPGWTSDLRSVHECRSTLRLVNDLNVPFGFVLFNIGDFTGRLLAARWALHENSHVGKQLVVASLVRFFFFPLLYLCHGGPSTVHRMYYVDSDFYSYAIQFAFAVSNGGLLSTAFAYAPSQMLDTPEMQERMSKVLSFAVALGLLCGSFASYPVVQGFGG